eukprot:bmy_10268T0
MKPWTPPRPRLPQSKVQRSAASSPAKERKHFYDNNPKRKKEFPSLPIGRGMRFCPSGTFYPIRAFLYHVSVCPDIQGKGIKAVPGGTDKDEAPPFPLSLECLGWVADFEFSSIFGSPGNSLLFSKIVLGCGENGEVFLNEHFGGYFSISAGSSTFIFMERLSETYLIFSSSVHLYSKKFHVASLNPNCIMWETCLEKEQVLHGLSVERLQGYSICVLFINEWKWIWKLVVFKLTYNPSILSANQEGVATI